MENKERFAFDESQRKEIYKNIRRAEARGCRDAERRYPNDLQKQFTLASELQDRYKNELANKLGISRDQLDEIGLEGIQKNWPFPAPEAD